MEAFSGYALHGIVQGQTGIACLWNPADSGVTVWLDGITGSHGAPTTCVVRDVTATVGIPVPTSRLPRNVKMGGPPSKAILHEGTLSWNLGNTFGDFTNPTNTGIWFPIKRAFSVNPGYGIVVQSNISAMSGDFTLQWYEELF